MILRGSFQSKVLHTTTNIQVLVPEYAEAPFRVVYLLHGLHGNQGTWLDYTMLPYFSREYNAVFVMPEAGRSFYLNLKYGRKYYDYVSEELPEICGRIFSIKSEAKDTAVMGCSMGGHGSLRLSLKRPDRFGFCGAISPACLFLEPMLDNLRNNPGPYLKTGSEAEEVYTDLHTTYGEGLKYNPDYDVSVLANQFPDGQTRPVFYACCGTEDNLRGENLKYRDLMKKAGFDYTYEEWTGGHEWYFFSEALKKTLEFWFRPNR